ncbi:M16 family metallopeptidase [Peptacetobacter hiranonis]|uniref:M16 family metallopeptidase n=1 Tax=Peptacetobacter hiranonis TaxID=89152 RepID=UPI0022E19C47|nr:pitrilysin family protein [Peptacetobacter hiranonis]
MYKTKKLNNGLTIIAEEIPYLKSISMGIWFRSGIKTEENYIDGVSHFIEHMMFKGTKNRTSKQLVAEIENLGGVINAFTGRECTCYYVRLLDEHLNIGIDILSDMILNSKFDEKDIEREKSVIIEELKMYEDSPEDLTYDILLEKVYNNKGIGKNILGSKESIKSMNRDAILDYFEKFYVPENAVLSICGNFDFEETVKLIEDKFENWHGEKPDYNLQNEIFNPCIIKKDRDYEQTNLAICFECENIGSSSNDVYAIDIINNVLGGSSTSRLFQRIREDEGLVYSIYSEQEFYREKGELGIYASMSTENLEDVYRLVKEEIISLNENGITEEELNNSKEQLKGEFMLGMESTESRMNAIGKYMLITGKVETLEDVIEGLNSITMDDINRVISDVLDINKMGVCVVGKGVSEIEL